MTPGERKAIAEELARECAAHIEGTDGPQAVMLKIRDRILRALDRVTPASRIQAAERAVVEMVVKLEDMLTGRRIVNDEDHRTWNECADAVVRLLALREQVSAETCDDWTYVDATQLYAGGAVQAPWIPADEPERREIRCDQPRGHEGKHSGGLGRWEWE